MQTGILWNIGKRDKNEDTVALEHIVSTNGEIIFAIICDGIGGLPEGEFASGKMAELAIKWFYEEAVPILLQKMGQKEKRIYKSACRLFYQAGKEIEKHGISKGIQTGTTCTMVILCGKVYRMFHIGDSRAYQLSNRGIRLLSVDQINAGGALERCVGSFSFHKPFYKKGLLIGKKGILLCTDGFYRRLNEKTIFEILQPQKVNSEKQITKRLRELGELSMKKGEKDNLSAIYIKTGRNTRDGV